MAKHGPHPGPHTTLQTSPRFDTVDSTILAELQADARLPFAELGRRVSLSTPAVIERVRKLEDAGAIRGYHARIDPAAVGLPLRAFIKVTIAGDKLERFAQVARRVPEVRECHRVTGAESFIVQIAVRDVTHLEQVIDSLAPYVATQTSIVLASIIDWNPVTPSSM